jgi:hypothetical protein
MAITTPADIVTRAETIKNEIAEGQNTASRVGSWMRDSWDTLQSQINGLVSNSSILTLLASYIPNSQKGVVNGVAPLDGSGKVPDVHLNFRKDFYFHLKNAIQIPPLMNGYSFANVNLTNNIYGSNIFLQNSIKKGDVFIGICTLSGISGRPNNSRDLKLVLGNSTFNSVGNGNKLSSLSNSNYNFFCEWRLEIITIGVAGVYEMKTYVNGALSNSYQNGINTTINQEFRLEAYNGISFNYALGSQPTGSSDMVISNLIMIYEGKVPQWGEIKGILANQTDLQAALDAKVSATQITTLQTQINAINTLLQSNDVNLDNVQELVDAIKTVQTSLATILVDNLIDGGTTKALTAEQGKLLKALVLGKQNELVNISDAEKRLKNGLVTTVDFGNGVLLSENPLSMNFPIDEGYFETVFDWINKKMYAFNGENTTESVDWQNRVLKDNNGNIVIDWENTIMRFKNSTEISRTNGSLFMENGALKFKGENGTVTTIAPA